MKNYFVTLMFDRRQRIHPKLLFEPAGGWLERGLLRGSFVINDGAQFIQEGGLTVIKPNLDLGSPPLELRTSNFGPVV